MADPILTPSQLKILKLLLDHKNGLTIDEIHDEITKENPEMSIDQVRNDLQELAYSYYARQESTNKWVITTPGLTAVGDMPFLSGHR